MFSFQSIECAPVHSLGLDAIAIQNARFPPQPIAQFKLLTKVKSDCANQGPLGFAQKVAELFGTTLK